jgi:CubicO group peptidase (beta-lactamase class C family)
MRERVFEPIGMSSATLDFDAAAANANHATPHRFDPSRDVVEIVPIDRERFDVQVAPGGGVWSNVEDVAKFAVTHFDGTTPAGTRIVSEASLNELHEPGVDMEPGAHYALGWEVWDDYLGLKSLRHTGNSLGFTTSVRLVQEGRLGVVVLANEGFVDGFVAAVDQFVLELLLGRVHADDTEAFAAHTALRDWLRDFAAQMTPLDRAEQSLTSDATRTTLSCRSRTNSSCSFMATSGATRSTPRVRPVRWRSAACSREFSSCSATPTRAGPQLSRSVCRAAKL